MQRKQAGTGPSGVNFTPNGVHGHVFLRFFLVVRGGGIAGVVILRVLGVDLVLEVGLVKQRVNFQRVLGFLLKFQRRQMQQTDGLL